ncbi:hypothetical protein FDECE_13548 [Fusarium decemcellulare]|nr:hypothetical protein FDECE_13548 [Fusarium decemcellulare]
MSTVSMQDVLSASIAKKWQFPLHPDKYLYLPRSLGSMGQGIGLTTTRFLRRCLADRWRRSMNRFAAALARFPSGSASSELLRLLNMTSEHEKLLLDVFRLFASDISWSCSEGSTDAERIVVEETGALLKAYIAEIPLHLVDSWTLTDEQLERLALLLESLFLNLEGLVSDDIPLSETATTELASTYPKLAALSLSLQREGSIDACTRFLSLTQPPVEFKAARRRVESIIDKIRRISPGRPTAPTAQLPKETSIKPAQFGGSSLSSANAIFCALNHHLNSCTRKISDHKALLHLKGSPDSRQQDQHDRVDMLLAVCPVQEAWQEVRCTLVDQKLISSLPRVPDCMNSICQVAFETRESDGVVQVHVREQQLFAKPIDEVETAYPNAEPAITLYDLLTRGLLEGRYTFPEKHKLVLAFNLAQCLLQLYSSPWMQRDWNSKQLYFMHDADKNRVCNIHQPYIPCLLSETVYKPDIEDKVHKYPFILSFGKLLLELEKGEAIRTTETTKNGTPSLLRTLKFRFKERCDEDQLSEDYARAIAGCLKFPKWLQQYPMDDELVKCRKVIQKEIVEPLGREVARFKGIVPGSRDLNLQEKLCLGAENDQQQDEKSRVTFDTNCFSSSFVAAQKVPRSVLKFSDFSHSGSPDKLATHTLIVLDTLSNSRKAHISRSGKAPRVKIAVLDTGLKLDDYNVRALKREIERDSGIDVEGHGTHVVGLLLKVAPEADIYAFRWAVEDIGVDIISMSFGFDVDPVWKVDMDQAIRGAYDAKKLVFAAASNYGANRRRTYPANATTVFCIHATDGNGNRSGMDPVPLHNADNFSTLGVAVPCGSVGDNDVYLSGSSYSTPIAVGIAANILDHAAVMQNDGKLTADQRKKLHTYEGMKAVFELMACRSDDYDYLAPWNLWHDTSIPDVVWGKIKERL